MSLADFTFTYVSLDFIGCVEGAAVVQPNIVIDHNLVGLPELVVGDDGAVLPRLTIVRLAIVPGVPRGRRQGGQGAVRPLPNTL